MRSLVSRYPVAPAVVGGACLIVVAVAAGLVGSHAAGPTSAAAHRNAPVVDACGVERTSTAANNVHLHALFLEPLDDVAARFATAMGLELGPRRHASGYDAVWTFGGGTLQASHAHHGASFQFFQVHEAGWLGASPAEAKTRLAQVMEDLGLSGGPLGYASEEIAHESGGGLWATAYQDVVYGGGGPLHVRTPSDHPTLSGDFVPFLDFSDVGALMTEEQAICLAKGYDPGTAGSPDDAYWLPGHLDVVATEGGRTVVWTMSHDGGQGYPPQCSGGACTHGCGGPGIRLEIDAQTGALLRQGPLHTCL